jgi:hypothetical protein
MEFWDTLPSGGLWIHEIKHDGFRIVARKNGAQVRLYNRPGNDLTGRIPCLSRRWQGLPSNSAFAFPRWKRGHIAASDRRSYKRSKTSAFQDAIQ